MATDRRTFLGHAAATAAAALAPAARADTPDPIAVGLIGCGGMGNNHLRLLAARRDVRVAFLCDPDANRLAASARLVESAGGGTPKTVKDLRAILDDKAVQAVWIATPDHWHAPATVLACDAGKHAYVEKPCSHNIREGRLMLDAARRADRVVQVGTQARSSAHALKAIQRLREGVIGTVLVAKAWNSQLRKNIGHRKPESPPAHLDFDLWLGPAPQRPYQANLLPGVWRFWHDFGAGDIGNDGVHELDVARWGLGVAGHPSTVTAAGSKFFFDDDQQFPDTQSCVYEWPGDGRVGHRRQLVYEQRDWSPYVQEGHENGVAFYGTQGYMIVGKGSFQVFGPKNKPGEAFTGGKPDLAAHHQNFLDCVRAGRRPNADVEEGHLSAALAHLGNIACRVGRVLRFDPQAEQVVGDAEANRLVRRTYRDGHWAVPRGV
jgi:predicted dehydrogenase